MSAIEQKAAKTHAELAEVKAKATVIALNLLATNAMTAQQIADITQLSVADVLKLKPSE